MTAKEKAKALVDRFLFEVDQMNPLEDIFESAKKCALICVDEIFRQPKFFIMKQEIKDYWREVKQKIEEL